MKHNITIGCSKENLANLRSFVEQVLRIYEVKELEIHKLVLAVDEICANIIIHGHQCNGNETLHIEINKKDSSTLIFLISDQGGEHFDISNYQEPILDDLVHAKRKGGLGLMLVKRIMDDIQFYNQKNHNICRLVKYLN